MPAWLALLRAFMTDETATAEIGLCGTVFPALTQVTLDVFVPPRRSPYDPLVLSEAFYDTMLEIARRLPTVERIACTTARGGAKMRVLGSWAIRRESTIGLEPEPFGGTCVLY